MAGAVLQNGTVTPGHLVSWTTDGVIADAGATPAAQRVLGSIRGANFNVTSDQPILFNPAVQVFALTGLIVTNASVSLTTATGGFYSAAAKGGGQIVGNTQSYSALTSPTGLMNPTLQAFGTGTRFSSANLPLLPNIGSSQSLAFYFSLTVPQGGVATADIYAIGIDLT